MPVSKKGLILTAITFEMSLYRRLHKEMGLKSAKVCGLSFLGIRAIKVAFREERMIPVTLVESTADRSSLPSRSKKYKKNSTGHPSGPRLLSFLKD